MSVIAYSKALEQAERERRRVKLYRVLVERTIIDQYDIWADSAEEANDTISNRIAGTFDNLPDISEELESEVRWDETMEIREWT